MRQQMRLNGMLLLSFAVLAERSSLRPTSTTACMHGEAVVHGFLDRGLGPHSTADDAE